MTDRYHTLDLFPDVTKTLDEPFRMAILSNGSSTMLRKLLSSSRLNGNFEQIIRAESVRSYKPAVAVYRLGQTGLKVAKRRTLFVSSNAWDIAGAKTFGFVTAWVNRKRQTFEELGSRYDYEISSLRQLPCIVGR